MNEPAPTPSRRRYVPAVGPRLARLLFVVFGLFALLAVNSVYLVAVRLLEGATEKAYQNWFYLLMFLLHLATRDIPIGTAYAVWVGIGAVGAYLVSTVVRGDPTSGGQVVAMGALVASIVAVKLALLFLHLQPLAVVAVQWMNPAKRFHGEIEDQLEVRDTA